MCTRYARLVIPINRFKWAVKGSYTDSTGRWLIWGNLVALRPEGSMDLRGTVAGGVAFQFVRGA